MQLKELPNTVVHCKTREEYEQLADLLVQSGLFWHQMEHKPSSGFTGYEDSGVFLSIRQSWSRFIDPQGHAVVSLSDFLREQGLDDQDLKVGDWAEVLEDMDSNWGNLIPKGKYRIANIDHDDVGLAGPWEPDNRYIDRRRWNKLRKCSPPDGERPSSDHPNCRMKIGDGPWLNVAEVNISLNEAVEQLRRSLGEFPRPISFTSPFMDCCSSVVRKARDLALSPMERKYRKLGLKDSDGTLSDAGWDIFLDLLFQKFGKELMDPVVKKLAAKKEDDGED